MNAQETAEVAELHYAAQRRIDALIAHNRTVRRHIARLEAELKAAQQRIKELEAKQFDPLIEKILTEYGESLKMLARS